MVVVNDFVVVFLLVFVVLVVVVAVMADAVVGTFGVVV